METFPVTTFRAALLSFTALAACLLALPRSQAQTSGKDTFTAKCVMCHAEDGTGSQMGRTLKVPNLRSALIQKKSNVELTQVISQGKANMPAFGAALSDDEVKEVIAYVRTLASKKK
jgi:cytochrome c6